MIADPDKIDELALYLQKTNHARARMRSRRFSRSGALVEALPRITARLDGIWGERDATAYPHVDERAHILRSVQPDARFAVVPGAGHWVQYEAADRFNPIDRRIRRPAEPAAPASERDRRRRPSAPASARASAGVAISSDRFSRIVRMRLTCSALLLASWPRPSHS